MQTVDEPIGDTAGSWPDPGGVRLFFPPALLSTGLGLWSQMGWFELCVCSLLLS